MKCSWPPLKLQLIFRQVLCREYNKFKMEFLRRMELNPASLTQTNYEPQNNSL
jgi:hypothetical protein